MSSYDSIPTTRTPVVEVVEMKTISAGKAAVILVCAGCLAYLVVICSGGAFTTTNMRGGDTTATTVLATVTGGSTTEEPSCIDRYDICVWGGVAGHCCYGRTCLIRCL